MSTTAELIASAADLWGSDGHVADPLAALVRASNLLGADRAVSNFGGGNTSAKGSAVDHTGNERSVMWVKGSGSDLATIGPQGFTVLRLQEVLPLIARSEMSDEEMVAHLVRCQFDPAMPRPSIETLLHAFVPAAHVHHTHPDGINILAGSEHGEQLVRECFGDSAAWIPYIRPGFALSKQVGEAVRATPGLRLIVLAKHGLVVWGDTAEEAYHATIDAINTAIAFVNQRTKGARRFDGPAAGALDDATRHATLMQLLPAIRGATSSQRSKLLCVDESPQALEFVSSRAAPELVTVGAPCPDHLVHTKRVPLWVPFDPAADDVETLATRIRDAAEDFRVAYRAYVAEYGPDTAPMDPDARVVLVQHLGLVGVGPTLTAASLSRDLYHRAMEVMAGAHAVDRFVSLTPAESFAVEYWPLELYKLSLAPPPRELQGRVALVTGAAGGIGRAIVDALAALGAAVIAFDLDGEGAQAAIADLGPAGLAVQGDVTSEADVAGAFRATMERYGGVDIVVSNAGVASSAADRGHDARRLESQPRDPRHRLLPRGARGLPAAAAAGQRRVGRVRRIEERAGGGAQCGGVLVRQGRRAAPRALPGRGGRGRGHPRQHRQSRRSPPGLGHLGLLLAPGASGQLRHPAGGPRGALPQPHDARREHPPRGRRRSRRPLRLGSPLGQEHRQHPERGRRSSRRLHPLAMISAAVSGQHVRADPSEPGRNRDRADRQRPTPNRRPADLAGRARRAARAGEGRHP